MSSGEEVRQAEAVRADRQTLAALQERGVKFLRSRVGESIPDCKWKQDYGLIDPMEVMDKAYSEGRFIMGRLMDSDLFVIDIDHPKEKRAIEIMDMLDTANCPKALTRRGIHYYLIADADSSRLLRGKARLGLKSSSRKNAKPIGDVVTELATSYRIVNEPDFRPLGAYAGLFQLLGNTDSLPPSHRLNQIEADVMERLRELPVGERNAGSFALLCSLNRRLKQAGAADHYDELARAFAAEYDKLNPGNAGHFSPDKIREVDERIGEVAEVVEFSAGADIAESVINSYLASRGGHVLISADESRDIEKDVYEWDLLEKKWRHRKLGIVGSAGETLRETIRLLYCELYQDTTGGRPETKVQVKNTDLVITRLQDNHTFSNPRAKFDCHRNGETYLLGEEAGKEVVYRLDAHSRKAERMAENLPEYMIYANFGEIASPRPDGVWMKFLEDVLGDEDTIHYFGQIVASAFVPGSHPRFIICNGGGSNGKSVMLTTLAHALGDFGAAVTFDAFAKAPGGTDKRQLDGRRRMVGKRIAVCTETDGEPLDMAFIKALTSGELIEVGGMYRRSDHVKLDVVPMIATNDLPRIFHISHAVRRRVMVVPFDRLFGDGGFKPADPNLTAKLDGSLAEVRGWIIRHISDYLKAGGEIAIPARVAEASNRYVESLRSELEKGLEDWLDVLPPDIRLMKLGRREGTGRSASYSGVMRLAMLIHEAEGRSSKPPTRKKVREWLEKRNILPDEKGRLNCEPSARLLAYLRDEVVKPVEIQNVWGVLFSAETAGRDKPEAPLLPIDSPPPMREIVEPQDFNFNDC